MPGAVIRSGLVPLLSGCVIDIAILPGEPAHQRGEPHACRTLCIREFMAQNIDHCPVDKLRPGDDRETAQYVDWLTLYNGGDKPVNTAGWVLEGRFPKARWGLTEDVIEPEECRLVIHDESPSFDWHASYKIQNEYGLLTLYRPSRTQGEPEVVVDEVAYDFQRPGWVMRRDLEASDRESIWAAYSQGTPCPFDREEPVDCTDASAPDTGLSASTP